MMKFVLEVVTLVLLASSMASIHSSTHALAASTPTGGSTAVGNGGGNNGGGVIKQRKVIVSGAGGQTGQSLFRLLLESDNEFYPIGLVRSEESKKALVGSGIPPDHVVVCDVTDADAVRAVVKEHHHPTDDDGDGDSVIAFCIATSAKPVPNGQMDPTTGRPLFGFPNGNPELVDWIGQKNQIDACPPGCHVVLCSTMGGTDPNHPLNNLGRVIHDDGTVIGGNIVKWKRKAEMYLIEKSNEEEGGEHNQLKYTIIHPGGLLNEPGGERELVVGINDDLSFGNTDSRTVPRQEVARVMLEAIRHPDVYNQRSFDLRAKPVGEGTVTTDFAHLLDSLEGANCDYTLGETM